MILQLASCLSGSFCFESGDEGVDLGARVGFSDANQEIVGPAGIETRKSYPTVNPFFPREFVEQRRGSHRRAHHKLVKERTREGQRKTFERANRASSVVRLLRALTRGFLHAATA